MAGFKRTRYLSCFYCGCKTSTRYDGHTQRFDCPKCEATNYLDENGEITDPPVSATEAAAPRPVHYAVTRPGSPPSSPPDAVFCSTCLKNQHLVAASLAQYLPDSPDAPDYAELDKNYYRFRRGLEKRYPQVCAECEPRARRRIEQSAYTAKTDALRRLLDRSQRSRAAPRQRSLLDLCDTVGACLRVAGLILQILWHLSALLAVAVDILASPEYDVAPWIRNSVRLGVTAFGSLPGPDRLIRWSLLVALLGVWWNPRFVQTIRGFTKHLVGFPHWYFYQAATLLVRFALVKASVSTVLENPKVASRIGFHLLAMMFTLTIYRLSAKSIRTDTTPLFGSGASSPRSTQPDTTAEPPDDGDNLTKALDEIIQTTTQPPGGPRNSNREYAVSSFRSGFPSPPASRTPPESVDSDSQFRSLSISNGNKRQATPATNTAPAQQGDEMDWSPTQSQHRAFSVYRTGQQGPQGFNQSPTNDQPRGHFWYHVPPAPTTPAQRLFNPPNQPRLRKSPVTDPAITFQGANDFAAAAADTVPRIGPPPDESKSVTFAEPSFFPSLGRDDPRDSLSELFVDGFSLTTRQENQRPQGSWVGNLMGFMYPKKGATTDRRRP